MNISNFIKLGKINNNNANAQQLNITTLFNNHKNDENKNIELINTMFNNNNNYTTNHTANHKNNNKYEIKKYLGEGIKGSLYMAFDKNNVKYICKKINLDTQEKNQHNQLLFELNLLKFLSSNRNTREYVNPCLEYKIIDNQVFTIFPIFNGYSLNHLKKYLFDMNNTNYYKILFHLTKVILHGLAKIHQHNVAHQNINDNSILVSTYTNIQNNEMKVKFTDFGLGCGVHNNYLSKIDYNLNTCNNNQSNNLPHKITNSIIKNLSNSEYLQLAQQNDIKLLATLFIQLLLFFEKIELDLTQGYNDTIKQQIKKIIIKKFLSKIEDYRKNTKKNNDNNNNNNNNNKEDPFVFLNTNNKIKIDILEYLNIFNDYVLCEDKHIKSCQFILDKLIIYEKYKNDTF